jgi:ABC-2 type transport system permease protein
VKAGHLLRALPTLFRVGFAEAVAYRAEMLVWILATTMPLVMLALWTAVARQAPIGPFGEKDFVAYFLATLIVRQLTGSWAAWQLNFEVKNGALAARLLRPLPAVLSYAVDNLSALPMRLLVSVPVAIAGLVSVGRSILPSTAWGWLYLALAVWGGWLITFLVNIAIGTLSFFMESSNKLMDVWMAAFLVFSGYLIPVELFPNRLRAVADLLPFRYQIGLPVEIFTSRHAQGDALSLLARQWLWVLLLGVLVHLLWRRGLRRFAAYGG